MAILYRHIRLDKNEVFYIGIGKTQKRAYSLVDRNKLWKNIANKGYEVEVLFEDLTWEQAVEKEKEFISLYGRQDLGLGTLANFTNGGDGTLGYKHTEETLKKKSLSMTGFKHSEESKNKISNANKGAKVWNKGKKGLQEAWNKGIDMPNDTKEKIRLSKKGKPWTQNRIDAQNKKYALD